jgi:hypothetical protein
MSEYVLVGGSLSGGEVWNQIAPALKAEHHSVFTPILKSEKTHNLSDQIEEVSQLILWHDLKQVILVGASYCGMVITGVANQIPDRIALLVYLDAILPKSGQSVADIFALAHFDPKIQIKDFPTYTEKLYFNPEKTELIPKLYVLCTESNFKSVTTLVLKENIAKDRKNWTYQELAASHLPMVTHPEALIQLLLDL